MLYSDEVAEVEMLGQATSRSGHTWLQMKCGMSGAQRVDTMEDYGSIIAGKCGEQLL
jgi:hypothetical protein